MILYLALAFVVCVSAFWLIYEFRQRWHDAGLDEPLSDDWEVRR